MLRIERGPGSVTVVSRFSRPQALAVLTAALGAVAIVAWRSALPAVAGALVLAAILVAVVGGRATCVVLARGRVRASASGPLGRATERPLAAFSAARIESLPEARRHRAESHARAYRLRAGRDLPGWLRPGDQPGGNEHLRRVVLDAPGEDPFPVTAWLADGDLEALRAELQALLAR